MEDKIQSSPEEVSEQELAYLEMQADMGITKHMGGIKATEELIELCDIDKGKYVLDVGCGIGTTACYLAKRYGCRVVGVDISEKMIDWSNERAKREGVENRVKFRVADAQNLPFEDTIFDAVICESVIAFIKEKQKSVSEYVRVTKKGGYVGLNEATWIKAQPSSEILEYLSHTVEKVEFLTSDGWEEMLKESGLKDIVVRTYKVSATSEFFDRVKLLGFKRILEAWYRFLSICIVDLAYRKYTRKMIKESLNMPKGIFEYWGYGIYVGRK
ncbi:MAG: methyltransferase domain-containing protein [Candidatus Methylarchaceae archaeon HK02M1]|nr:methyltransferase domain-containing protein [Candidatus Methylarchaceae archaeon HK02M1]